MITGHCHCGAVAFTVHETLGSLTECNCTLCRRIGALWFHTLTEKVTIKADPDATIAYVQGDAQLAVHSCKNCGGTTHYTPTVDGPQDRMAVNTRMCDPVDIQDVPIRHFDGADTWAYLD